MNKEGRPLFGNSFSRQPQRRTLGVITVALCFLSFAGAAGLATAQDGPDLARGEQLFTLCTQCHSVDGGGNSEVLAPAIAGLPVWYIELQLKNFKNGVRGLHAEDTGGLRMYPMSLWLRTEADQNAVAAYVASLPSVTSDRELEEHGDAAKGAGYYAICSACHGADGSGNQGMGAPPLTGQSDWYLYSSIVKYKTSVRGTGAGDMFGPAMIGMVATLPDDNAVLDVIAHIQSMEK
jgi:cytochrome c553